MRHGLLGMLAVLGFCGGLSAAEIDVWTFNLRYASDKSPNSWAERRPVMKELLTAEDPDIIGTQEGLYAQLRDLDADLPDHDWIGTGREGGSRGEFMAIFYRRDRFEPLAFDHLWLSDTPEVVGSKSWGNAVVRMVTWVKFRDRRDDSTFVVVNTHFDHQSEESRRQSATFLAGLVTGIAKGVGAGLGVGVPVILTGDFNTPPGSIPIQRLRSIGLVDSWVAAEETSTAYATFHGYREPVEGVGRIDLIFVTPNISVARSKIHTFAKDGQYPSDHFPVSARVRVGAKDAENR